MKGHIRKRSQNSWAIILDLGRDEHGRRKQKWHSVRGTKRDAERELARLVNEINTGDYVEPSRMSVREFLDRWVRDYVERAVSPKTAERYKEIVDSNIKPAIGGYALSKLKPLHIQSFYTEALTTGRKDKKGGLSAQTVLHIHRVLHKALGQGVKWQLLPRNPADAVETPRPERKRMTALDGSETAGLLQALAGTRLHVPVLVAVTTGLRRGEFLALHWNDVDLDVGQMTVHQSLEQTSDGLRFKTPKTDRGRRQVALPSFTVDALRAHKVEQAKARLKMGQIYQDQDLVFPKEDGLPWAPDAFSTAFAAFVRNSGLAHVRLHDLRHSHATQLLKQGVHPKVVSERLGHSKISITLDTYSHVLPGMQEDAAQKIDSALRLAVERSKP
jgi:integrase